MVKQEEEKFIEDQEAFNDATGDTLTEEEFILGNGNFIKSPEVGESIEFVLASVKKKKAKKIKNPKTGQMMDIRLSGDDVDYYYDFIADDEKVFTCSTWQIVGKTKAIVKKLGSFGFRMKIQHVADGRKAPKGTDAWKVYADVDGEFKELDRESNEWKTTK